MAKISTSKRVIGGISYFDKTLDEAPSFDLCISQQEASISAYVTATEIEMCSKNRSDPIPLNRINQEKGAKSVKRKKGSKPLKEKITFGEKKKINNVAPEKNGEKVQEDQQETEKEKIRYYVLNRPVEAPHMQAYTNHNVVRDLKQKLSLVQFNKFKNTCFGVYIRMHQCFVQPQIFRCLMVCELEESSSDALLIRINHSTLRFSLREFAIITGLNCVADVDDFSFNTSEPNRLMKQYFEGKKTVKKFELIRCFKNKVWGDKNDDDAVKIAILYFINTFIFSKEKNSTSIPRIHFDLVESGRYSEYPWGKKAFKSLAKSISKKMDAEKQYYRIAGMPLAMQVWLYECCSSVDSKIAVNESTRIPRLLNWKTIDKRPHYECLMEGMFRDNENPKKV